jgi:hypothetical protein
VDILIARDAPVSRLDRLLDGPNKLLTGDLLLGVQLEEGTDEISTHDAPPQIVIGYGNDHPEKKNVGVTHVTERPFSSARSIHPRGVDPQSRPPERGFRGA